MTAAVIATAFALFCAAPALAAPASVSPTLPPHVPTSVNTDVCAMCHRAHTSASDATWDSAIMPGLSGSALLAVGSTGGDTEMCYVCHGVDTLGSGSDIQSALEATSAHSVNPDSSAYGPSPKQCSTCHDSHGSARVSTGTPFPALLRTVGASGTSYNKGNEVCAACHVPRAGSSFEGLAVFSQTAHARIATPAAGTGIVCDACHDPHGSPVAPMIRSRLGTPSAPATFTVTANDRGLCLGCHEAPLGTWSGGATYVASHASSPATVSIPGEWPAAGASRRVGECQVCHNPTGSLDSSGALIPRLLGATQPTLCLGCHRTGGPAKTDLAALSYSPTTPGAEVLASFAGSSAPAAYGQLQVYSREATAASMPLGPQQIAGMGIPGAIAAGDLDGNGVREAIVADSSAARVSMVRSDPLRGVTSTLLSVDNVPAFIAVGDVLLDGSGLPELVVVSPSGQVDLYRYDRDADSLTSVASIAVIGTPTGLSLGDVTGSGLGGGLADVVVTTKAPNGLWIITESGAALNKGASPFVTSSTPVAVAVGDAQPDGAKLEIAVASEGGTDTVQVFDGAGTSLLSAGGAPPVGTATAILVGDVLTGFSATSAAGDPVVMEIAISYATTEGASGVRVFPQPGTGGLGAPIDVSLPGSRNNPASMSLGDVDGDGKRELAVALAGRFTGTADSVAPAVTVLTPNASGTTLTAPGSPTFPAGGVELAGSAPFVLIVDIGAVGPSRHASASESHVSTESPVATMHVTCTDCHDPHLAVSKATSTAALPGPLFGARRVVPNGPVGPSSSTTATAEYQVCFKCHAWQDPLAAYNLESLMSTTGASFHPVEGALSTPTNATGSTLVGVTVGSTIRCTSCHGTTLAAPSPRGPHASAAAPLLVKPFLGTTVSDSSLLCYSCHRSAVYLTGADDGVDLGPTPARSGFFNAAGVAPALHSFHAERGLGCESCHVSHGSTTLPHLLRADGFTWTVPTATDGACGGDCHEGGVTHGYKR